VSVLGAKSHQQQEALQKTISELREALSGNRTLRSANEEVLERRVAELEASLNHSEHLLTVAQQTADLVQAPLLKHVADLQSQLAHQQRSIEAVEESWKEQIQNREQSLSERTQELSRTQNQLRMAEQANHKLQAQYAKLELQYQEISLEHDQLMNEFTALDSLSQELKDAQDSIQTLEAQLASALAAKQQMAKNHESTLSQLNAQIQSLQTRITSLTTPGFGSIPTIRSEATQTPEKQQKGFANFEDSAAPSTPLGQASNVMTAANSSAQAIQATPKSNLQHQHANAALEAQIQKLKLEKSRLEDILANTMNSAALSEEREKKNKSLVLDMERLQERLDAALELVADQSERLQFVDEEIRETKQLYKDEISNLVSQLQTAQVKIKDLEQMLNART
jgi:myosin heavy subunit